MYRFVVGGAGEHNCHSSHNADGDAARGSGEEDVLVCGTRAEEREEREEMEEGGDDLLSEIVNGHAVGEREEE